MRIPRHGRIAVGTYLSNGGVMADRHPFGTRAGRKLRDRVVEEEPDCTLGYPNVCTGKSTTADHVKHWSTHPELGLERSNLRGACDACNRHRNNRTDEQVARGRAPRARALDIFRPVHD